MLLQVTPLAVMASLLTELRDGEDSSSLITVMNYFMLGHHSTAFWLEVQGR